jgi:hypothetical protein
MAPAITLQPANQTVTDGQIAQFTVAATGSPAPAYQWQLSTNGGASFANLADAAPYNGVGTATLLVTNATPSLSGHRFRASATNTGGSTASNAATLTVNGTPATITTQPHGQNLASGQTTILTVVAAGTTPLTYQWYVGASGSTSTPIAEATSSSYTTPVLTSTTSYWVRVSNPFGSPAVSDTATIRIYLPFTDDQLLPGTSPIRAAHITELRIRIDALRARFGLKAFAWTDPTLTTGMTMLRAQHLVDLRTALSEVYTAAALTPPTYTDPVITAGVTAKLAHIAELRAAVIAIE